MKDTQDLIPPKCDAGFELDHEVILEANNVKVEFDAEHGFWSLIWKHGTMGISQCPEKVARETAGLFIYLWLKRIPASIADKIMDAWVVMRTYDEQITHVNITLRCPSCEHNWNGHYFHYKDVVCPECERQFNPFDSQTG